MIISENSKPTILDFRMLMRSTDELLNNEAIDRQDYYSKRNGTQLEEDVFEALQRCAVNTPFENTIVLVSGASFPDIVANRFYGVEVKSTIKNQWKSIGSSILESTRNQDVERIFLTFGKLGKPVSFKSRPYEECLSGISVTHYPRYQIDMELSEGETIFDKMGVPYDELRKMDNPVVPVSKYYKNKLKPGESLWWAADADPETVSVPPIIRLWTSLSAEQKNYYTVQGYALFPEILGSSATKYQRYALWLATRCSIVNTNIRDQFSAGGKVSIQTIQGTFEKVPAAYGKIKRNAKLIAETIFSAEESTLIENWKVKRVSDNRLEQWCRVVSRYAEKQFVIYKMLCGIFGIEPIVLPPSKE
jgi:hypothetical protein